MKRRDFLRHSGMTLTGLLLSPWAVYAFPNREGEVLVPFTESTSTFKAGLVGLEQIGYLYYTER